MDRRNAADSICSMKRLGRAVYDFYDLVGRAQRNDFDTDNNT